MTLFDDGPRFSDMKGELRRVTRYTAERWFGQYHYIGSVGNAQVGIFGLFTPDLMATVAVGIPANVMGIAARYGLEQWRGNVEITRVAVHPAAPSNTASHVTGAVCRQLAREGWDWLYSYADTAQGHHGGIYQALNAVYLGLNGPPGKGWMLDGVPIHPRSVVSSIGTQARVAATAIYASRGQTLEKVEDAISPKHTYVLPIASKPKVRYRIRRQLGPYTLPYPKRDGQTRGRPLGTDPDFQSGLTGSNPVPRSIEEDSSSG